MSYALSGAAATAKEMSSAELESLLSGIVRDPVVMGKLSPVVRAVVGITADKLEQAVSQMGGGGGSLLSSMPQIDSFVGDAMVAAQAAAGALPIVSWFTSLYSGLATAAATTTEANVTQQRELYLAHCRRVLGTRPQATSASGDVLPVDIFVGPDGPLYQRPGIGLALMAVTEPDVAGSEVDGPRGGGAKAITDAARLKNSSIGLSAKEKDTFYRLRLAMQANWKAGDGGLSIWPLYVNLLRNAIVAGKFGSTLGSPSRYMDAMIFHAAGGGDRAKSLAAAQLMVNSSLGYQQIAAGLGPSVICAEAFGSSLSAAVTKIAFRFDTFFYPGYPKDQALLAAMAREIELMAGGRQLSSRVADELSRQALTARGTGFSILPRMDVGSPLFVAAVMLSLAGTAGYLAWRRYGRHFRR